MCSFVCVVAFADHLVGSFVEGGVFVITASGGSATAATTWLVGACVWACAAGLLFSSCVCCS